MAGNLSSNFSAIILSYKSVESTTDHAVANNFSGMEIMRREAIDRKDRWLERAGFNVGDKITVDCQQGRLVITKDDPEANPRTG